MPTTEYRDIKAIAGDIRAALKREFPATKFSVRIDRFSGGSSCDVRYLDGPTVKQVNAALRAVLDTDSGRASYQAYGDCWNGSHYYDVEREYSVEAMRQAAEHVTAGWALYNQGEAPAYTVVEHGAPGALWAWASLTCECYGFVRRVYARLEEQSL